MDLRDSLLAAGGRSGYVNPDGVAFYDALIDALLEKGIHGLQKVC